MDFRFAIDLSPEEGGQEVELIPNSRNIRVTPTNVFNYVRQYALYRMVISQLAAIQAIRAGIFDVLPCKSFEGLTVSVHCALPFYNYYNAVIFLMSFSTGRRFSSFIEWCQRD